MSDNGGIKSVGKMEPAEMEELNRLRQTAQAILLEIGQTEVRKARLMVNLDQVEAKAHEVMTNAAKRVGITEGVPWQITKDGDIVQMPGVPPQMQVPPGTPPQQVPPQG